MLPVCITPDEADPDIFSKTEGIIVALDVPFRIRVIWEPSFARHPGLGCRAYSLVNGTVDPFHPKVVRSTAGATGTIPFRKGKLSEEITNLESAGFKCSLPGCFNKIRFP